MRLTDEEIERAIACNTPTASAAPAPAVLEQMRAAMRAERRQHRARRLCCALAAGSVPAAYLALALSIVALVVR